MAEPKPVVPTLHNISTPMLTKLGDQLAYVIRFYFANPGRTSSNNEDEMISFRKLNAKYGNDPGEMCARSAAAIEAACRHYKDDARVSITYEMIRGFSSNPEDLDPEAGGRPRLQGSYTMDITVSDSNGNPLIPHRLIKIMNNGDAIDVTFDEAK